MDKLDELLTKSKTNPSEIQSKDFTNRVMAQIDPSNVKSKRGRTRIWSLGLATSLALALVVVLSVFGIKHLDNSSKPPTTASSSTTTSPPNGTQATGSSGSTSGSSYGAGLDTTLDSLNSSLSSGSQNLSNANSAVNDQQQEISVPTS